jgi:hypothetical protein
VPRSGLDRRWLFSHAPTWLLMSQIRPFSVVRALSAGTVAQFAGSDSASGFANDSVR